MNKKNIAFRTFGCKLNFSETSSISRTFSEKEFKTVGFREKANIYVINSCCVTKNAEKKSKQAVKQTIKLNPDAIIVVIGCLSQLKSDEIADIKGVDIILGNAEKYNLLKYIQDFNKKDKTEIHISKRDEINNFIPCYSLKGRTRSFLKIQDGCDYFCSYCIVPFVRGKSRYNTIANTIKNAKEIAATQTKEIVLSGINIGDFGKKNNETFYELMQELEKIKNIDRIRISSIEPDLLSDDIIEFVAKSNKFLPHFHIPLQSGSDRILKIMHRRYKRKLFADKVKKIKSLMPYSCIAADVIVGFPDETDEDFEDTYNFIKNLDISYLHIFTYSERENTLASDLKQKVPDKIKYIRSKKLHKLSDIKKEYFYKQNFGKTVSVLFESKDDNGYMYGFSENYIKVKTKYNPKFINNIFTVKLKDIDANGIFKAEL